MFDFGNNKFEKFEKKLYLSSPTMHGEELEYVTEAYKTNWMSTVGKNVDEVEQLACAKIGCNGCFKALKWEKLMLIDTPGGLPENMG